MGHFSYQAKQALPVIRKGMSIVEALLAVSVFALLVTAFFGAWIYGQEATVMAGNNNQAVYLAEEGLEAVRNMRDGSFANLADGTYGLAVSGGQWVFSGSSDTTGIFTRQIVVSTVDAATKKITATITWSQNLQRNGSYSAETQLSKWRDPTKRSRTMLVYSKSTATPFYQIWENGSWGSESQATNVSADIQYIVIKFARSREEAILGTLDSAGDIRVQVWNGTSWGSTTLLSNIGTTNDAYRGFDIDYETASDRAVVVYNNANSADPAYRVWNGSSWSGATTISAPPTTGAPLWIELAANPGPASDEIAMMLLDANADTYGMAWNGSAWGTMGTAAVWDASVASSTKKSIDVAYEQTSGRAMFIWGDSVATDQYYRIWNGSSLTAVTLLDIPAMGGIGEWVQLASRSSSNEIMYGVQDAGSDLNTRKWSGTAWDTATQHAEHDASLENITSMNFDIVYERYLGNEAKAWLVWGDGATVSAKQWSGTAWGATATLTGSDDTSHVRLHSNPGTGEVFAGIYESNTSASDDIAEWHLTGGGTTWSAEKTVWGGPISAEPVMFRVEMDSEK